MDKYVLNEIDDIVILTPGTIDYCCIADRLRTGDDDNIGYYVYPYAGKKYRVSTCRKFKGLEADAIIILDLDKNSFTERKGLEFYVGTSRAKKRLDMICQIKEEDFPQIISDLDPNAPTKGNLFKILGGVFSAEINKA